jgi:predicted ribosomally synthesized peptide with SipW-like signal peptide
VNASKKIRVLAALGTLSAGVWAGTFASFSDTGSATAAFTTGTIDLKLNGADSTAFTALELSNLKPGDSKVAALTVANPTSSTALPFNYSMSTAATNADGKALRDRLRLQAMVVANEAACTAAAASDLAYSTAYTAAGVNVIPDGALSAAAISSRAVAAGASEVWCFKVVMPNGTTTVDNPYQGAATTATFTFNAVQQ